MIGFIYKKLERVRERYQIFIRNLLDEQFLYILTWKFEEDRIYIVLNMPFCIFTFNIENSL